MARFRKTKSAIKLHTLLDLRGNIPSFVAVTDGKIHDVNILDVLMPEPGAIYIMDKGYLDFVRLFMLHKCSTFFVTRAKINTALKRLYSKPVDKSTGIRCDQIVVLTGFYAKKDYPETMRRVKFVDPDNGKRLVFLTNQFSFPAETIAALYKCGWQVELFFKWIKQHLRIKAFYGTSENAVKTQAWIAISVYVLVINRKLLTRQLKLEIMLHT